MVTTQGASERCDKSQPSVELRMQVHGEVQQEGGSKVANAAEKARKDRVETCHRVLHRADHWHLQLEGCQKVDRSRNEAAAGQHVSRGKAE